MIRNIAFDVGGVLLAYNDDVREKNLLKFLINEIGIDNNFPNLREIVKEVIVPWFDEEELGINLWSKYFPFEITNKIIDQYKNFHVREYPLTLSMVDLAIKLSEKYQIGVLSNFAKEMVPDKENDPFDPMVFKTAIFSGSVGIKKPDKKIYQIYCEAAGCRPEEILFIDDRQENVEGAKNIGMSALLFTGQEKLEKDLRRKRII